MWVESNCREIGLLAIDWLNGCADEAGGA